ncbi:MAG: FkbM family methyltransferase [Azospirillum sp.]|jgi:FkbM family methyltransferase|nr:FkbM family methyltransferase [Azospirillum sp.]MCZ8124876.1 FkbM family methyltransferase [Magnetospirillum sp.]
MYHKESFAAIDDAALRHLGATLPVVRYLVIGANDGLFGDPLIAHTGGANWRGTLFEPVPDSFARLQANYAGRAGARLRRQAVVADAPGGVRTFHSVPTAPVLASFRRDTIESHRKFAGLEDIAAQIVPIEVPCVAVAELVAESDFEPPDVLLTDTEGYDYDLFAAWWPLGWRPAYARIEIAHVGAARRDAIEAELAAADYALFRYDTDVCGLRRDAFPVEDMRVWTLLRDATNVGLNLMAKLAPPPGGKR